MSLLCSERGQGRERHTGRLQQFTLRDVEVHRLRRAHARGEAVGVAVTVPDRLPLLGFGGCQPAGGFLLGGRQDADARDALPLRGREHVRADFGQGGDGGGVGVFGEGVPRPWMLSPRGASGRRWGSADVVAGEAGLGVRRGLKSVILIQYAMEQEVVGWGPRGVGIVGSSGGGGQEGRGLWIFRVVWVARRAGEVGRGVGGRGGMGG